MCLEVELQPMTPTPALALFPTPAAQGGVITFLSYM